MSNTIHLFTVCVALTCVLASVYGRESYAYHNSHQLGHMRLRNGTFLWGDFPLAPESSNKAENPRKDGWDVTVDFAIAVVDSVQTQAFPYDLLRRIIRNDYSESEVVDYQTNVAVVTALGGLLAAVLLLTSLLYFLWQWRRGNKGQPILFVYELEPRRAMVATVVGALLGLLVLIFVLCTLITSAEAMVGSLQLGDNVHSAMDDVIFYFDGMHRSYDFISSNTSKWFLQDVLVPDLDDVGRLVWEPGWEEFLPQISGALQQVSDIDTKAANVLRLLSEFHSSKMGARDSVVDELQAALAQIHYNLTLTVQDFSCIGCDGSACAGCAAIVPDDIFLAADFSRLKNLTGNIEGLSSFLAENVVSNTSRSPEYYSLYGIGDQVLRDENVTNAKDELIRSLLSWDKMWGNSTDAIIYPNASVFWFDSLRPRFDEFYKHLKAGEIARFTMALLLGLATVALLGVTVYAMVLARRAGLFRSDKTGNEDIVKPKRLLGWCIVGQLSLASCYMMYAAAGFYTGANLQKAVCEPGQNLGAAKYVIDYQDALPGHSGLYLSSVMLGNGSLASITLQDVLKACGEGSTAYPVFLHHLLVPNLQQDLTNYTQHFNNLTEAFEGMKIGLDPNTSLVPPDFETWLGGFVQWTDFNYTFHQEMLQGPVTKAVVDDFINNLQAIHDTDFANGGPFDPAKSRLLSTITHLQNRKEEIAQVETLKNNLAAKFAEFVAARTEILMTSNDTMEQLQAQEPALVNMSADAIARGADAYKAEFVTGLNSASNVTWPWFSEAAPCQQLTDAYYSTLTSFCDQYADYVNASWLLAGHVSLLLVAVSLLSLVLIRAMHNLPPSQLENFGVSEKSRILTVVPKKDVTDESSKRTFVNQAFDKTSEEEEKENSVC